MSGCVAIIPARAGSKRVPDKNVKSLMGKPIIAYTIEAAIESDLFERVVVSTDSERIAEISQHYGADVPFLRSADLADDHTPVSLVTLDALNRLDPMRDRFACVAQLMPNCPLRTCADVRASYQQFADGASESQLSVTRYGWQNPWWAMQRNQAFQLEPLFEDRITERSQDLPELFCHTGAIWWAKAEVLRRHKTYHVPNRTGWEIPWRRAVDIDTEDDWRMAELLMRISERVAEAHV